MKVTDLKETVFNWEQRERPLNYIEYGQGPNKPEVNTAFATSYRKYRRGTPADCSIPFT